MIFRPPSPLLGAASPVMSTPVALADTRIVLAVLTPARTPIFPDVPSVAEAGFPGFEASVWYGFIAPAGLAPAVVTQLHGVIQKAMAAPEVRDRLVSAGGEVQPGPTELLTKLIASEQARYSKLIREAAIKPD